MIEIEDLEFRYRTGDFALRIPSLTVDEGTRAAVVGPSGCGKTTLLNLLAGVVVPDRGRIRIGSRDVGAMPDAERRGYRIHTIGMVFQEFELLEHLSVLDNILLPARIAPGIALDRGRAAALAETVGLADKLARLPRKLSQGERQRVAVCRALYTEPVLLLADEPTGNLDPRNSERVLDALLAYGVTLLAVMHDHALLDRFDRVIDAEAWA